MDPLHFASPAFAWLDAQMAYLLSDPWRLGIWGLLTGVVTMTLYAWFSNQRALTTIRRRLGRVRGKIDQYEGDFSGVQKLLRKMLGLSLRQLGMIIGPVVLSTLPALLLFVWLGDAYLRDVLAFGPGWMRGWECPFFAALTVSSLSMKWVFRIH